MKEFKTLKDLDTAKDYTPLSRTHYEDFVDKEDLRQEAIKWIKDDFELVKNPESHRMLERWKERFNITENE